MILRVHISDNIVINKYIISVLYSYLSDVSEYFYFCPHGSSLCKYWNHVCVRARVCVKQLSHVFFISLTNRANIEVNMHVFMQPLTHLSIRMCVTEETLWSELLRWRRRRDRWMHVCVCVCVCVCVWGREREWEARTLKKSVLLNVKIRQNDRRKKVRTDRSGGRCSCHGDRDLAGSSYIFKNQKPTEINVFFPFNLHLQKFLDTCFGSGFSRRAAAAVEVTGLVIYPQ